jgi:hypothetical protein
MSERVALQMTFCGRRKEIEWSKKWEIEVCYFFKSTKSQFKVASHSTQRNKIFLYNNCVSACWIECEMTEKSFIKIQNMWARDCVCWAKSKHWMNNNKVNQFSFNFHFTSSISFQFIFWCLLTCWLLAIVLWFI